MIIQFQNYSNDNIFSYTENSFKSIQQIGKLFLYIPHSLYAIFWPVPIMDNDFIIEDEEDSQSRKI